MSDAQQPFGFAPFLPGMDFLQQLTKAGQSTASGPLAHWMSPSLSVEDIDKRIEELKAVQFWLEQNSAALTATVQALQVQKMTLSTLKSMNVNLGDLAKAFPWGGAATADSTSTAAAAAAHSAPVSPLAGWPMSAAPAPHATSQQATEAKKAPVEPVAVAPVAAAPVAPAAPATTASTESVAAQAAAVGGAQAMQWWGTLTQQFQQIAAQALQDPMQQSALQQAGSMATQWTQAAAKTASDLLQPASSAAVSKHSAHAASVSGAAEKPKAASTGKPAGKTATKAAAKAVSSPPVGAATTAALKSATDPTVGGDQGVAPVRPRRTSAVRKRSD